MNRIIPRSEWGAVHEDGFGEAPLPAREVWLHHSVTIAPDLVPPFSDDDAAVRTLERIGEERFARGISYTFVITPVGRIYEGHGIARQGSHTAGRNSIARAICLVGNYEIAAPTVAQLDAVVWLLREGKARGWWTAAQLTGGHRDAPGAATACPGRLAHAAIAGINERAARAAEVADMTPEFERDVRAMWKGMTAGGLALLEKDLRGDLAHKQAQLDQLVALMKSIDARLAAIEQGGAHT